MSPRKGKKEKKKHLHRHIESLLITVAHDKPVGNTATGLVKTPASTHEHRVGEGIITQLLHLQGIGERSVSKGSKRGKKSKP